MSVQFGRWNFQGQPPTPDYLEKVSAAIAPYGPDSNELYSKGSIKILYCAFRTTKESHREKQPYISSSGTVITWDGRLDNRADLISELRDSATVNSTDVSIVAAAFEKWGVNCLGKLIGDWALSLWNPRDRSVLLAKDPIGTKHLYYSFDDRQLTWSTILDPLVMFAGKTFEICEEYIAGWFSYFPAAHLTPYVGIQSVPPSSSVLIRRGNHAVTKYWDFDPGKRIHYRTNAQYEEHFRAVFAKAVQRRLRSDRPVLAELSGGMDSSSIVCMADTIIARGEAETPRLDTISWYDDSYDHIEPDTNEQRYFSKVEDKRGRTGFHIDLCSLKKDVSSRQSLEYEFDDNCLALTPYLHPELPEYFKQYAAYMTSQRHRVVLSGIGGDESTGGDVPTPTPELQDLMARARFFTLVRQLSAWATKMRKHRFSLLWQAVQGFVTLAIVGAGAPKDMRPAHWIHPSFVHRNCAALSGYPSRVKVLGPLPSFQENIVTLDVLRRLFASWSLHPEFLRETRFPYLDRDFLEFVYAIPRVQVVGVGKRRFLMKRALHDIVPPELLNRRRKAFIPQESKRDNSTEWPSLVKLGHHTFGGSLGIVDSPRLFEALQKAKRNEDVPIRILKRTLTLEFWLRHLSVHGVLACPQGDKQPALSIEAKELSVPAQTKSSVS